MPIGAMGQFEQRFGADLWESIPATPGVYWFTDAAEKVVYVGRAKNLHRRIGEHRRAINSRSRARKTALLRRAQHLHFETADSLFAASLRELHLIQEWQPPGNVSGKFFFMYPYIGLSWEHDICHLLLTATRFDAEGLQWFGAFRSRSFTAEVYFALRKLLLFSGRKTKSKYVGAIGKYGYAVAIRLGKNHDHGAFVNFLRGEANLFREHLALSLLDSVRARKEAEAVQEKLELLGEFFAMEAQPLSRMAAAAHLAYPVDQKERDALTLRRQFHPEKAE